MTATPAILYLRFILLFGVLASQAAVSFGQSTKPGGDLIHPGDLIEVDELGGFDYDWRGRLDADGNFDGFTKVADPIFGRCRSTSELGETIRQAYSKTLREPRVVVRILDRSQRPMAIFDGAIRQPTRLQIRRAVKISELVVIAGGFTDRASGEISVLRPPHQSCDVADSAARDTAQLLNVRVSDILAGKNEANLTILPGDIVTVKPVEPVYVLGGVNVPGRIDWREGATVSRVVAAAGGASGRGVTGRVTIFRSDPASGRVVEVDLDRILRGKAEDLPIYPKDIIEVPLKGSVRRTAAPTVDAPEPVKPSQSMPVRVIE